MVALATRVVPCNSTSSGKWPSVSIAGSWHPICESTGWVTGVGKDSDHSLDEKERANLTAPHQHCRMRALGRSTQDWVDLVPRVPHGSRLDAARAPPSYSRSRWRALLSHPTVVSPPVAPTNLTPPPSLPATPFLGYCHFHLAPASPAALQPSPLLFTSSSLAAGHLLAVAPVLLLFHVLFSVHAYTPRLFSPVTSGVSSSGWCSIARHLDPQFGTMQWPSKHAGAECGTVLYSASREEKCATPWKGGEQQTMRRRWGEDVATDTPRKPGRQIDILGSSLPRLDRMTQSSHGMHRVSNIFAGSPPTRWLMRRLVAISLAGRESPSSTFAPRLRPPSPLCSMLRKASAY